MRRIPHRYQTNPAATEKRSVSRSDQREGNSLLTSGTKHDLALHLTRDGSYTLKHAQNPETYHSMFGAVTEAESVFLINSGVQERLRRKLDTSVLEIGFGSGLNFLLTAAAARKNHCGLYYHGFDLRLPPVKLIGELLSRNTSDCYNEIENLKATLSADTTHKTPINNYCNLTITRSDVLLSELPEDTFDAVYLDAFSIAQNPLLWQSDFLEKLHCALKTDGKLATYSVNRRFKDALTTAGFSWQKLPGPGGKREVIVATAGTA